MKHDTLVIEPGLNERHYWQELWRYRELFVVLAKRDVVARYKQTAIGATWALIQPFLAMVVFTIIFGNIAKLPSDGKTPYSLMVYAGLLPWQFFASALTGSSNSLVNSANLISKIYFPRLIIPTSSVVLALADLLLSLSILAVLMIWYNFVPDWKILTLPFFIIMAFLAAIGPGLWLTALNVKYRDFRYIIPFVIQFGLYISPVGFSSNVVPEQWRPLYSINPLTGVIEGFRWAILGGESNIFIPGFIISWIVIGVLLWLGLRKFREMEKTFADII